MSNRRLAHAFLTLVAGALLQGITLADELVLGSFGESSAAPHGKGNVYAPDIIKVHDSYMMYFGAQGKDGHDRIHLATSKQGKRWRQQGVVFEARGVNHVNDPSVVLHDNTFYLFYTRADLGVTDSIGLAVSQDGRHWKDEGAVFRPSKSRAWDSWLVGRPSVIHNGNKFRMWYDGRKDLPPGSPDERAPKSPTSRRFVGHATSIDGRNWKRSSGPVLGHDAGGIHVTKLGTGFIMVIESRKGTEWADSVDGLQWTHRGVLVEKSTTSNAPHGHVTPFLLVTTDRTELYFGAASAAAWNQNEIRRTPVSIP